MFPLTSIVEKLVRSSSPHPCQYSQAFAHASESGGSALARAALRDANARLIAVERVLTLNEGLPNRPWFKHQVYAPGFYTGYGVSRSNTRSNRRMPAR